MENINLKPVHISILLSFLSFSVLHAQSTISGSVLNESNEPLEFANVLLLNVQDSSLVQGTITDASGAYIFHKVEAGSFLISSYIIGFSTQYTAPFTLTSDEELAMAPFLLEQGVTLDEVEITAQKPLYEQKIDRLVINVENSVVSVGATALQVLERSPGVNVDRFNNTISLQGKSGVNVMINDKISYMPISSLVQFLDGMPADNIEAIELITTPPAKYDAEGNAGYIHIILKKRTDEGLNGNYSLSSGYGRGLVTNDNLSFNYRKGRLNLFGGYSFSLNQQDQTFITYRTNIFDDSQEYSNTVSKRHPTQRNHNLRMGIDYQLSDKTYLGGILTAYDNKWSMTATNVNDILFDDELNQTNTIDNTERNQWQHIGGNLNLKHQLSESESIDFSLDYLHFYNENPTNYTNVTTDGRQQFIRQELIRSGKVTPIDIYVGAIDYQKAISDRFTLELGAKGVTSRFDNDVLVENENGGNWIIDPQLTSASRLAESILAGYISTSFTIGDKTNAQIGVRYEYTDSQLDTETQGTVVDREFGRFFPSVFLSHQFSDEFSTNLSYSRRITRPGFNEMAPFVYFIDPNNFFAGNTALQPAISDGVKVDLRHKSIFLSVQYTYQDSTIAPFQQQIDPETNRLIWRSENLDDSHTLSFTLGFPLTITNWWQMRNNAIYFIQENNAFFAGDPISLTRDFFQINTTQTFTFSDHITSEIAFNYTGPSLDGTLVYDAIYALNAGINIDLGQKWGRLGINANDLLNSFEWNINSIVGNEANIFIGSFDWSHPTLLITYSNTFGNSRVKAARTRKTTSEEERRRVN